MQVVENTHPTVQAETLSSYLRGALVRGGSDCKSLIKFFAVYRLQDFHVHIIGVADLREGALGSSFH